MGRGGLGIHLGDLSCPSSSMWSLLEKEAEASQLGSRPICCGQELWRRLGSYLIRRLNSEMSAGTLESLNQETLASVWGVPLTLFAFLLRPLSPEALPG